MNQFDFTMLFQQIIDAAGTFYTVIRGPLAALLLSVSTCVGAGACTFNMYGEGKAGVGYSSTSEVYAYHRSMEGNKSKAGSSTELSEPVTNWLFPVDDPKPIEPEAETPK